MNNLPLYIHDLERGRFNVRVINAFPKDKRKSVKKLNKLSPSFTKGVEYLYVCL